MRLLFLTLTTLFSLTTFAQDMQEVLNVINRANDYFMAKWSDPTAPTLAKKVRPNNLWTRAVYMEGLLAVNDIEPQERFTQYIDTWGNFHKWGPYSGNLHTMDADHQCCAQAYLTRYSQVGGDEKISTMRTVFDNQIATDNCEKWTWIDAIQMAMPAYAMMSKATNDRKYIDYAIKSYLWTRNTCGGGLFDQTTALWWRDANFVPPYKENDGKNCYWSRGNGWVYAALCRTMDQLTKKDKYYKMLKEDFLKMSQALLSCQAQEGYWNASLVSTDFAGKELSGTSLFLYGMCWGVNHGYLKAKVYRPAIDKAWKAASSCVHNDGFLGYVQGSGDRPASNQPVTNVKEPDFDDYGTGCFLLGATEYYRLLSKE